MNLSMGRRAALVLLVIAGAAAVFGCSGGDSVDSSPVPETVGSPVEPEQPPDVDGDSLEGAPAASADTADATLAFLEGDGAALLTMHEAATSLSSAGTPSAGTCGEVGDRLEASVTSEEALGLIGLVLDEVLRAALFQERTALGVALTTCLEAAGPLDDEMQALGDASAAVDERIRHLEEQR